MEDTTVEQRNKIQKELTNKYERKQLLFEETDPIVKKYVDELWQRILDTKRLDICSVEKRAKLIDADTMQHSNVTKIGAESICQHTWDKLQITPILLSKGWTEQQVQLASTQVISRAVYPASELKTTRWTKENSAVCELT